MIKIIPSFLFIALIFIFVILMMLLYTTAYGRGLQCMAEYRGDPARDVCCRDGVCTIYFYPPQYSTDGQNIYSTPMDF